jgi:energy-coupling factor transporter ATP-binding protein EcfA2
MTAFHVHSTRNLVNTRVPESDARLARLSTEAPRIPWDVFLHRHFRWDNGEHVGLIGPTGQGKTTLLMHLLPLHPYVTVFATKPRDTTMDSLIASGYIKLRRWESLDPANTPRRVLWPDATKLDSKATQRAVFADAFERIYLEGRWTLAIDETWYFDNVLNLGDAIKVYLLQARSLGISLAVATQRPAWVPREIYTQSTHLVSAGVPPISSVMLCQTSNNSNAYTSTHVPGK